VSKTGIDPRSGQTSGDVAAAIAAAVGALVPTAVAGRYYDAETLLNLNTPAVTAITMAAGRWYAIPMLIPVGTFTKLGVYLGAAAAAGKLLRCALWSFGADGLPGALLLDGGGDLPADGSAGEREHTIALTVTTPTLAFAGVASDGTPQIAGYGTAGRAIFGWPAGNNTSRQSAVFRDVAYGAPSDPYGAASFTSTAHPRIWLRT
jgi:hypothetical protein